jgi:hypothetical protein
LLFKRFGVIHVVTAVITAQGANMTTITEQTETAPASAAAEPKVTKKPRPGARVAPAATKKPKSGKKSTPAKKAPTARKSGKKATGARDGSKAAKILELLKRPGGATSKELQKPAAGSRILCAGSFPGPLERRWV